MLFNCCAQQLDAAWTVHGDFIGSTIKRLQTEFVIEPWTIFQRRNRYTGESESVEFASSSRISGEPGAAPARRGM